MYGEGYSLSDIAAATGNGTNGNNGLNDGFGAWWVIIFLIFAFGGWGRNGYGNNGNGSEGSSGSGSVMDAYILNSDFATLQRQLDTQFNSLQRDTLNINNGLCQGFYTTDTNMLNGFGNVQQSLCSGFATVNNAITTNGYETRLGVQNLASQLANCCCNIEQQISDCCCQTQTGIQNVNYNMAMNTNAIQQTLCNSTRDIIDSNNANYRALHDEIVANRIEDKNAQIQAQQNEINALRLSASQQAQNNYLINELKPCPIPCYVTCNPYTGQTYNGYSTGCNCGC